MSVRLFWLASITSGTTEQSSSSWVKSGTDFWEEAAIILLALSLIPEWLFSLRNCWSQHWVRAGQRTKRCSREPSLPLRQREQFPVRFLSKCRSRRSVRYLPDKSLDWMRHFDNSKGLSWQVVHSGWWVVRDMKDGLKYVREGRRVDSWRSFFSQKSVTLALISFLAAIFVRGESRRRRGWGRLHCWQRDLIWINHDFELSLTVIRTCLAILWRMLFGTREIMQNRPSCLMWRWAEAGRDSARK